MRVENNKNIDIIVIGSGLSGLNFVDTYLEKKQKVHVISPNFNTIVNDNNRFNNLKALPSQMEGKNIHINNYFSCNKIKLDKTCKALGSLNRGGLSDYWGLQLDSYISKNQKNVKKETIVSIQKNFLEFLKKYKLLGTFYDDKKVLYENDYITPNFLNSLLKVKDKFFECKKPILGFFSTKLKKIDLDKLNEKKQKFIAKNFFRRLKKKKNIKFHNFYVEKIQNFKGKIKIICKDAKNQNQYFLAKKVVFATGTIVTTKILLDYLKISKSIKIKHHPRLLGMFFSRKPIKSILNFTPSLMQIINKSKNDYYAADLRPGNRLITNSIIEAFPFMSPFKIIINFLRRRLLFSNILLDSSFSNIFMKKDKDKYKLFFKSGDLIKKLRQRNYKVFKFLLSKKMILPIFKTFYPGNGADYHYFGSIPFGKKGKLSVNNNCQLNSNKNIYIVDGSIFDFKTNKYPLGIVIANSRRIGRLLSR